jgi:hypothetical protein
VTTRVYATSTDLAAYTGSSAPANADALLAKASRFLDSAVFRLCWFVADANGLPTDTVVIAAFRDAVCAQAAWWGALGDSVGAIGAGYGSVEIGSVKLQRSGKDGVVAADGSDSPARQIAPEVWDVLRSPDLTLDHLWIGAVVS